MSASFTVQGTNLQIQFTYVAPTQQMTDIATNAAHQLYNIKYISSNAPKPFEQLTNNEKLALLDEEIVKRFTDLAKTYYVNNAVITAQSAANTAANQNYSIP